MTLRTTLTRRLSVAFESVLGVPVDPAVRPSRVADYQADAAMRLARVHGRVPRDLATEVVAAVELDDLCTHVEVAGPGFINLTLSDRMIAGSLTAMSESNRLDVSERDPQTIVIDYSAPNIAKEMHVGHLRSTIIGDAAARLLEWLGHAVIRRNHVGDWGTPFGMLIEHLVEGSRALDKVDRVEELDAAYKAARRRFDEEEDFRERARDRVVQLQAGEPQTVAVWTHLVGVSRRYFATLYERLDVTLRDDDVVGESSYHDELEPTLAELAVAGLLEASNGALCAFLDGFEGRDGEPLPLIVRKSDGGYGYAATDLAAIRRRTQVLHADRLLYVVGLPQRQHLAMVFALAKRAGWLNHGTAEHIGFGSVLGDDGRMLRSRAGNAVKLADLLEESVERARELVIAKGGPESESDQTQLATQIGVGSVKYADLSTDRTRDYVFDLDRMVSLDGDTGPYLQYAHARTQSILRQADSEQGSPATHFETAIERELALQIATFEDVLRDVERTLEFHRLTSYLFGLATTFSSFYEQCPVLRAPEPTRGTRVVLCDVTGRVLRQGLSLLGIEAPARV